MEEIKLSFVLTDNDDWPGFSTESFWVDSFQGEFRLKNIPFFVKNIAYDDDFRVSKYNDEGDVEQFEVTKASGNSTIWIYNSGQVNEDDLLKLLEKNSIGFEAGVYYGLITINLPASQSLKHFDHLVSEIDPENNLVIVYPTLRHLD